MRAHTLLTKAAAGLGTVALALLMSACSHNNATANTDYGNIRTEQAAHQQPVPSDQVVAAAPAPSNTKVATTSETPAVISGPAKVDSTGRLYTSSSVGSAGNASSTGLNTDVNIIPKPSKSTVTVTESPTPIVETTPAPAPVVVETTPTPAPPPPVVETPAPMTSSTTTTQTTHRRLRKD